MVECPSCQVQKEEGDFIETYISSFNNQKYKLYQCHSCDLQWWEPLKIIPEFYESEGEEGYKTFHLGLREEIGENHKMFFRHIPLKSGRLLDVGSGDGVFLKEARKAGYEVWGIDFDSKSIKVCQKKWGLKNTFAMTHQEFADFCQKEGLKFDIITFFAVLEHQDKPKDFLETIKSMLKPGGYIAGYVPNRDSWFMKMYNKKNKSDFPPHHFLRFSEKALYSIFKSLGFKDIFITDRNLREAITYTQVIITGTGINFKIFNRIFYRSLTNEMVDIFRKPIFFERMLYKTLRGVRFIVFLPFTLPIYFITKGVSLYFQGNLSEK